MNTQRACEIQAVLEGVPLPASRSQLIAYARTDDAAIAAELQGLPDQEFDRLDEVAELLMPRPTAPVPEDDLPRPESGAPPGGGDYLTPFPTDTGRVCHTAPRDDPPQKEIEQASTTQKEQQGA